ncbi:alpha/beta hydrolase [Nucisporomicrobium flavum]|uniref:alpha/beta hydrolase n=1 Tax=Nucisporomicrobium flavum TaxID=2785915 RepID=UPI0027DB3BFF|nr:dienelactone hydrolase family protein [Nucisporomicrobium flavum]
MANSEHLNMFVLPVKSREAERHGRVDLFLPDGAGPRPAVVFVHGGPVPEAARPTPRDWPVFQAYGSLAASRGLVGVTLDHRLHTPVAYAQAADDVTAAVELARADPRVDRDRVALWFFSGGGLLAADWLRRPAPWLRCLAATYPLLSMFPGWPPDPRFAPVDAVASAGTLPVVLTRAGLERPEVAAGVSAFVDAARAASVRLEVIDVPNGRHGFDYLDDTDESREAIEAAFTAVSRTLTSP